MERTFKEALRHRRSYYALAPESPVTDAEIEEILRCSNHITFNSLAQYERFAREYAGE